MLKQDKHPRFKSEDRTTKFDASALQAYILQYDQQSFVPGWFGLSFLVARLFARTSVAMTTMMTAVSVFPESRHIFCRSRAAVLEGGKCGSASAAVELS